MFGIKKIVESKESKILKSILNKHFYKVEYNYIEINVPDCNAKFELANENFIMNFEFIEFLDLGMKNTYCTSATISSEGRMEFTNGRYYGEKMDKQILMELKNKYYKIIQEYQEDIDFRYRKFIKELNDRVFDKEVISLESKGIEMSKKVILRSSTGIDLIFIRESDKKIIQICDSDELYIKKLDFNLDTESFVSAKVRKLDIPTEEKEILMDFVKKYIISLNEKGTFYTEEELILSKINSNKEKNEKEKD